MKTLPPNDLLRRQSATAATEAKFRGKPFDWKAGMHCLAMARFHLVKLGHRVEKLPRIRGVIGAKRHLAARGWATCADLMDAQGFTRIAPAMMLPGDLAYRASADGLGGLLICVGAHKLMGWFPENTLPEMGVDAMVVMDMSFDQVETGWRV